MTDQKVKDLSDMGKVVAICTCISSIAYFIIVVWWAGLVAASNAEELAKHETCYERWDYSEAHQKEFLVKRYCGENND